MRAIRAAFSFLTILPLGRPELEPEKLAGASAWFPLVGALLGGIYFGMAKLLAGRCPELLIAFLILLDMVIITGGLHLDGLADWADGLGGKDRGDRLRIMKDPARGSFGIIAIALVLLGKTISLGALLTAKNFWPIFLAPILARFSLTLLISIMPYARASGTGEAFARYKRKWHLLVAGIITLAPLIFLNLQVLWISLAAVLTVGLIFWRLGMRLLAGFTGDLLGACAEACELAVLLIAALVGQAYFFNKLW